MKKYDVIVDRYEKEIVLMIDNLKEFVRAKDISKIENTIDDIADALKLYKESINNQLTNPQEERSLQENTGMYEKDIVGQYD